ncbi:MAG TPA: hypothetical protein VLG49_04990 [Rhabdochlamydiaceae bacterium]|nr:hypothetical protein [Rhabdochlamydiaceae bacterium]
MSLSANTIPSQGLLSPDITTPQEKMCFNLELIEALQPKNLKPIPLEELKEMLDVIGSKANRNYSIIRNEKRDYVRVFNLLIVLSQLAQQHPQFNLEESAALFNKCLTSLIAKGFNINIPFPWTGITPVHQSINLGTQPLTNALVALGAVLDINATVIFKEAEPDSQKKPIPYHPDVIKILCNNKEIRVMNIKRIDAMASLEKAAVTGDHAFISQFLEGAVLRQQDLDKLCCIVLKELSKNIVINEKDENNFSNWALAGNHLNNAVLTLSTLNRRILMNGRTGTLEFCLKNATRMQVKLDHLIPLRSMSKIVCIIAEKVNLENINWELEVDKLYGCLESYQNILIKSAELIGMGEG